MADETDTSAAEPTGIEQMVADAVSDLRGFCDSMTSGFNSLRDRMDAFEAAHAPPAVPDAVEVPEGTAAAIEPEGEVEVVHPPVEVMDEPAAVDAAMEASEPVALAADASSPEEFAALADSAVERGTAALRADIARLQRLIPAELTNEQRQAFATAQEQAEIAFQAFGDHAPAPLQGETIGTYKRRLAGKMQQHSDKWRTTKLTAISDDGALDVIIGDIYNDAAAVARRGADVAPGMLVPLSRRTPAGHTVIEYRGTPGAWMRPLAGATRRATGRFNTGRG